VPGQPAKFTWSLLRASSDFTIHVHKHAKPKIVKAANTRSNLGASCMVREHSLSQPCSWTRGFARGHEAAMQAVCPMAQIEAIAYVLICTQIAH
jgi:hypothetical protein